MVGILTYTERELRQRCSDDHLPVVLFIHVQFTLSPPLTKPRILFLHQYQTKTCSLGFIADYDRNGWDAGDPKFSGDYFVPGAPVEGWAMKWTDSGGTKTGINKGLTYSANSASADEITPIAFEVTSKDNIQSALWVGVKDSMEITKVTQFDGDKLFFTTSVVIKNTGAAPLTNLYYMRSVDPDQEQVSKSMSERHQRWIYLPRQSPGYQSPAKSYFFCNSN